MKLVAKGQHEYVRHQTPAEKARAESEVVFEAFREAVEALMIQASTPDLSEEARKSVLTNLVAYKNLQAKMSNSIDTLGVVLAMIEQKVTTI